MTSLLIVSNGKTQRRCDARCYDARDPVCTCVCGGVNHAQGFWKALENVQAVADEILRSHDPVEGEHWSLTVTNPDQPQQARMV